jgi:hypothetical protein
VAVLEVALVLEDLRRRVQEVPLPAADEGRDQVVGAGVAALLPLLQLEDDRVVALRFGMPWSWSFASSRTIDTDFRELRQEFTSEGAGLWRYWRKKASFSFSAIRLWTLEARRMGGGSVSEVVGRQPTRMVVH